LVEYLWARRGFLGGPAEILTARRLKDDGLDIKTYRRKRLPVSDWSSSTKTSSAARLLLLGLLPGMSATKGLVATPSLGDAAYFFASGSVRDSKMRNLKCFFWGLKIASADFFELVRLE